MYFNYISALINFTLKNEEECITVFSTSSCYFQQRKRTGKGQMGCKLTPHPFKIVSFEILVAPDLILSKLLKCHLPKKVRRVTLKNQMEHSTQINSDKHLKYLQQISHAL